MSPASTPIASRNLPAITPCTENPYTQLSGTVVPRGISLTREDLSATAGRFFEENLPRVLSRAELILVRRGKLFCHLGFSEDEPELSPMPQKASNLDASSREGRSSRDAAAVTRFLASLVDGCRTGAIHREDDCRAERELYRHRFFPHPDQPGSLYGFLETAAHSQRVLFHTCGGRDRVLIYLLPEQDLGLYLRLACADERTAFRLRTRFVQKFMDRYFPVMA